MNGESQKDVEALRGDIANTRERISGEIEAIGDRLTPGHAKEVARDRMIRTKDRAVGAVRSSASRAADNARYVATHPGSELPRLVRENPIPTAMMVVGTGWMVANALRREREPELELELDLSERELGGYGETDIAYTGDEEPHGLRAKAQETRGKLSGAASSAREKMSGAASSARERMSKTAGATRERLGKGSNAIKRRASDYMEKGRHGARRVKGRSESMFDENPLALGAFALLAGIGLGMLLPHTRRENQLLGQRRAHVLERARGLAGEAKEVAIHSAREGIKAARETAKHDAEERKSTGE